MELPEGVRVDALQPHPDDRGRFVEIFRVASNPGLELVQWNAVFSDANVLRGVHCHPVHDDYLTVVHGRASIGLRDLRCESATLGCTAVVELSAGAPSAITIPHGVAHGFYFHEPSLHVYAVTRYWDPADELACHWADPELGIPWPDIDPLLSERDASAPPLSAMRAALAPAAG